MYINVKDFGAIGNGTTNDTSSIQKAINKAIGEGGGIVFFPSGVYKTTSSLICNAGRVCLMGAGHSTIIKPKGNFDTFYFGNADNIHIYGNKIMDMLFDEALKTGGHTIVGHYVAQFHAIRVYGGSGWNGWYFHNFNNVTLEHCRFESYRGKYYGKATGGAAGVQKGRSDVLRLCNLVFGGNRNIGMIGIEIDGFVHTVNGWCVHFIGIGAQALLVRNERGAEDNPSFFTFDDLESDYTELEAIRIDAGQRFFFNNIQLHGTKGATSNIFIGKNVKGISFTGGFSTGATQCGIAIAGKDVTVSSMHFYANSNDEFGGIKNAFPGILLGSSSRDVVVTGCRSGQEATKTYQSAGCQVDTGADGFVIVGNDFRYNNRSSVNNGAGSGTSKLIANNIF